MITIGEIIKSRKDDSRFGDTLLSTSSEYYTPHRMYTTYWLRVKQEIWLGGEKKELRPTSPLTYTNNIPHTNNLT